MRNRHEPPVESPPQPETESRLGGVRALAHDDDERPSREDRSYGETIFTRPPVPLPKVLRRRRRK